MDITYTMIGGDGQHYGPATLPQVKGWISEGRVVAETKMLRSDTQSWLPASSYVELGLMPAMASAPPPVAARPVNAPQDFTLQRRISSGASWFFWIAGLSLVNTLHLGFAFFFGTLGMTEWVYGAASEHNWDSGTVRGISVGLAVMYAVFGFFASKRQTWAFLIGGAIYTLDTVLFVIYQDWIVLGLHVVVLFFIFRGLQANIQARTLLAPK